MDPNGELKAKIDALTGKLADLTTKTLLTEQRVISHEVMVRDALADQRAEMTKMETVIQEGFQSLRADNAKQTEIIGRQTAIINKWGTVRDTLVYVCIIIAALAGGVWAVFTWATGHLWGK